MSCLARTLGFPACPLSVSAHPALTGPFPVSRSASPWELSRTCCDDECAPPPPALPWRKARAQATCLCCRSNVSLPTDKAVPAHHGARVAASRHARLVPVALWTTPRILFASFACFLHSRVINCSQPGLPMFLSAALPLSCRLHQQQHVDACFCVFSASAFRLVAR